MQAVNQLAMPLFEPHLPQTCLLSLIEASDHGPEAQVHILGVGATGLEPVTPSL